MLGKADECETVQKKRNPCSSPLVDTYFTFVSKEQNQVGVPEKPGSADGGAHSHSLASGYANKGASS